MKAISKKYIYLHEQATLKTLPIYFISFNVLCTKHDDGFIPNEIGLVEWSIEEGISRHLHLFIDGGDIPEGYFREAQDHSNTTHKIPIKDFSEAIGNERNHDGTRNLQAREKTFEKIALDIVKFTEKGRFEIGDG